MVNAIVVPLEESYQRDIVKVFKTLSKLLEEGIAVYISYEPFAAMIRGRTFNYVRGFGINTLIIKLNGEHESDIVDILLENDVRFNYVVEPCWVKGGLIGAFNVTLKTEVPNLYDMISAIDLDILTDVNVCGESSRIFLVGGLSKGSIPTSLEHCFREERVVASHVETVKPWYPPVNGVMDLALNRGVSKEFSYMFMSSPTTITLAEFADKSTRIGVGAILLDEKYGIIQIPPNIAWDMSNSNVIRVIAQSILYLSSGKENIRII